MEPLPTHVSENDLLKVIMHDERIRRIEAELALARHKRDSLIHDISVRYKLADDDTFSLGTGQITRAPRVLPPPVQPPTTP